MEGLIAGCPLLPCTITKADTMTIIKIKMGRITRHREPDAVPPATSFTEEPTDR
jgi:hypothetical protein